MKSVQKFSKRWKWATIGSVFGITSLAALSLGIGLAVQNKNLSVSSKLFLGSNSYNKMSTSLAANDLGNTSELAENALNPQWWSKFYSVFQKSIVPLSISSSISDPYLVNNSYISSPDFNTYQINTTSLSNLSNSNLFSNTLDNLSSLIGNQTLNMNFYTMDDASYYNSEVTLFTNSVLNSIDSSTNNKVDVKLISRTPSTADQVYNNQNAELASSMWSPDYPNVSAWIGYLFSQNNGWVTGNLWPCLWDVLAGANPENGSFSWNGQELFNAQLGQNAYNNPSTFAEQVYWTNQRRAQMGLGDLPGWVVSLYSVLFNYFGDYIAWNTPYGWWQLQYNYNDLDQNLQYEIQDWCTTAANYSYTYSVSANPDTNEYSINLDQTQVTYTNQSALVSFLSWIDDLVPDLPFYSSGNNLTSVPILTQKGIYPLWNPKDSNPNSQYFVNISGDSYWANNPYVYFINSNVVSDLNDAYFSPVLGESGFYDFASGLYSGLVNYVPYNYDSSTYSSTNGYSAGYGVTTHTVTTGGKSETTYTPSASIMKLIDANNFEILSFNKNFVGASYDKSTGDKPGAINHGDTIITSGSNANANILFIANPYKLVFPDQTNVNTQTDILTESQFSSYISNYEQAHHTSYSNTWSSYQNYLDFMYYHEINTSDINLINAQNSSKAAAYQFTLNKNVPWVNSNGETVGHIQPQDFNNSLAWMAAAYSEYSYGYDDGQYSSLSSIQSNGYMLQEIGIAGNDFNLGVGSGFFQTEEYSPNNSSSGDTFTYFLTPNTNLTSSTPTTWTGLGDYNISYFLSMLAYYGGFFDPIPSDALAFSNLPSGYSQWSNLTLGELTDAFMGTNSSNGVWNISSEMSNALNQIQTIESNASLSSSEKQEQIASYNQALSNYMSLLEENPAYLTLVADDNFGNSSSLNYLYGSGLNPATSEPDMASNLEFNGGYYALSQSFTTDSLKTKIDSAFWNSQTANINGKYYYYLAPESQKLSYVNYMWDANITKEEELSMYQSGQIDYDSNINWLELKDISLTGTQSYYTEGVLNNSESNTAFFNAQIYMLGLVDSSYEVPINSDGDPLISLDVSSSSDEVLNKKGYYGKVGYPYISSNDSIPGSVNVLYTTPGLTSGVLKSNVLQSWTKVVGTALNPFIYGTTGAEIRQDIVSLINWNAIAKNASFPLSQSLLSPTVIPYGNFTGKFEYQAPVEVNGNKNDWQLVNVVVNNFYEYANAVSGYGIIGSALYYTNMKNNLEYYYDAMNYPSLSNFGSNTSDKGLYYGYTEYQWQFVNAVMGGDTQNA